MVPPQMYLEIEATRLTLPRNSFLRTIIGRNSPFVRVNNIKEPSIFKAILSIYIDTFDMFTVRIAQ